jgi:tetratricopeptide (TPR) repeat protein
VFLAYRVLPNAQAAGFQLKSLSPPQYFYTECRALWIYLRLFCFPANQNADYDFPVSQTVFAHYAAIGCLGLIGLVGLAILFRRKYKLTSYGFILFLLLMAPTSSFIPILDPLVEHRLYLPSIGLLLMVTGLLGSALQYRRDALMPVAAMVLIVSTFALLAWRRNHVWSSPLTLWTDTVGKSPEKYRPRFQLAYAAFQAGNCSEASEQYAQAAHLGPRDYRLLVDWALAEDCAGRPEVAIAELKEAAALQPTAQVYSQIGLILGKQAKYTEALQFLHQAELADSNFDPTYVYRGMLYARSGDLSRAAGDFEKALALNPRNATAAAALRLIEGTKRPAKPH